ncbi:DUF2242 domain-containing protein [Azonexus sp. IMCC34839]|uniref:DUF2242 domain-containing protein n=1 Tax=Azonexus sp. IMCC34839 TaxID=3133695 RepID=UPI00399AFF8C
MQFPTPKLLLTLALATALTACSSSPKKAYQSETFDAETPFQFHSTLPPLVLCDYGKRALLSQGYDVDASAPQSIRGQKFFQPQSDLQVQLKLTLVCLATGEESTMYASALQTRHELKSGGSSTGLSVAGLGSISVPWPTDKNSLVKVGEETISDPEFYRRLFVLIDTLKE